MFHPGEKGKMRRNILVEYEIGCERKRAGCCVEVGLIPRYSLLLSIPPVEVGDNYECLQHQYQRELVFQIFLQDWPRPLGPKARSAFLFIKQRTVILYSFKPGASSEKNIKKTSGWR